MTRALVLRTQWLALLALVACAPVAPGSLPDRPGSRGESQALRKEITVAALEPVRGFGIWNIGTAGGAASVWNIHSNGLVSLDSGGTLVGRLASRLPSFDDRTIVVFPDGRMQTTWKLREGIKWHDGAPFTADDLVVSWQIISHPEVPGERAAQSKQIESVEAADPLTAVITWKTTFYRALYLDLRELWPLPRHLVAEAFEGDKQAFINLPYWTTEYVHLGPFRLVDYGLGENLVFERFDDYFLGRPRVDRIIIQAIRDPNTLFANLQARAIDMSTELSLPPDLVARLRDEWGQTGAGTVLQRQGALRYLKFQFHPEWGRPPELSRDPRVRRGLYLGLDRDAIREAVLPGFADTIANTFMLKNDARAPVVGEPFARYPYDPARAAQGLAEAGWSARRADGRIVNQAGESIQIPVRSNQAFSKEIAIAADSWRQLGLDVVEEIDPPARAGDSEYRAKFPGLVATARGTGDGVFLNFDSRLIPTPQNRYSGQNVGGFASSALDRLIDQLYATIDEREQALLLREMGEILAGDLPALPMYFRVELVAVTRGVRALTEDYTAAASGTIARNAHLWERD